MAAILRITGILNRPIGGLSGDDRQQRAPGRPIMRENLNFPLKSPILRAPKAEIDRKVGWITEIPRITRKPDKKATSLSSGEMQRAYISRALARDLQVYLMDEPLSSLGAKLRVELKRIQADPATIR